MAKVLFLTCYDSYCLGIRIMARLLEGHGHEVSLVFFKIRNEERINQPIADPTFSQSLRGGTIYTNHYRRELWSKRERQLLLHKIKELNPDMICFSSRSFLDQANAKLLPDIKKTVPSCVLIAGGYGPTKNPRLYANICDYVGIGEGEELVLEIANAIENGKCFRQARNLFYRNGNGYVRNALRPLFDVDKVELPKFGGKRVYYIEDDRVHNSDPAFLDSGYFTIMGRGCTGKCSYCTEIDIQRTYESYSRNPFTRRNRNIKSIMMELEFGISMGFKWVYFADSFLVGPKSYLLEFFRQYKARIGRPLWVQLHLNQIIRHPAILDAACDAGVRGNVIGIQSGSERFRREVYNRKFTDRNIIKCAQLLQDRGVGIEYHIIAGNQLEAVEHIEKTFDLLKALPFRPEKDILFCFQLVVVPGTPLASLMKEKQALERLPMKMWLYLAGLYQLRLLCRSDAEFERIRRTEAFREKPEDLCPIINDAYCNYISRLSEGDGLEDVRTREYYSGGGPN